jgi:hypothetical protein
MIRARVDDLPRWLAQLERLGVRARLDEYFPAHGTWVGLSLGWVAERGRTSMLSAADHRLNRVEPWAEPRLPIRRGCTGGRQSIPGTLATTGWRGSWRP